MNIEQAKAAVKDAMQRFEGEGWDDSELEQVIKFIDQQEKDLTRAYRDARDNEDRARI